MVSGTVIITLVFVAFLGRTSIRFLLGTPKKGDRENFFLATLFLMALGVIAFVTQAPPIFLLPATAVYAFTLCCHQFNERWQSGPRMVKVVSRKYHRLHKRLPQETYKATLDLLKDLAYDYTPKWVNRWHRKVGELHAIRRSLESDLTDKIRMRLMLRSESLEQEAFESWQELVRISQFFDHLEGMLDESPGDPTVEYDIKGAAKMFIDAFIERMKRKKASGEEW